ncbi:hypothetical protein [Anaerobacillus alkalidiazotrophicus]
MGVLRLVFLVNFLSQAVISDFTSAPAFIIYDKNDVPLNFLNCS